MICTKQLNKSFGDRQVLFDITTQFEQGKTNLIIGQSGSGKTVLLKSLVGLHPIDSGTILYDGRDFTTLPFHEKKSLRQEIGMLFQGGALFDAMTVEENVGFPLKMFTQQSESELQKRVDFCLDRVELSHAKSLMPSELSGGMIKRVAIARAIALNPKYLFCDEPNSGLDPRTAGLIDNLILEITQEFNITTIINTHDINSMLTIGNNIAFIFEGKLWWEGNNDTILESGNAELDLFIYSMELTKRLKKQL